MSKAFAAGLLTAGTALMLSALVPITSNTPEAVADSNRAVNRAAIERLAAPSSACEAGFEWEFPASCTRAAR